MASEVHPIVQAAASALEAHEWEPGHPLSAHRRHLDGWDCAVCQEDTDQMAGVAAPAVLRAAAELMPPAWSGAPAWLERLAVEVGGSQGGDTDG